MADIREIDALARLRLAALRGQQVAPVEVPQDVRALIAFCGLEDVLSPLFAARVGWRPPAHWTRVDDVGAVWPPARG